LDRISKLWIASVLVVSLVELAGCKHKVQTPVATAPPAPSPQPTANISASPAAVTAGEQVTLTWNTTGASTATIDGVGDVSTAGTKTVTPSSSTTYHLLAKGNGGTADAYGRVTVTQPPVAAAAPTMTEEQEFQANVKDVFFDYDKYNVRTGDESVLSHDAEFLKSHPDMRVVIGGYCDERGSDEYNLGLGQNRASAAQKELVASGIPANRVRVISYGKEKPFCTDASDPCMQENRRAGFSLDR
jgi:peptidoglycan-associated lipoprotein